MVNFFINRVGNFIIDGVLNGLFDHFCYSFYVTCRDDYRSVDDILMWKEWMLGSNRKSGSASVDMPIGNENAD